ncbi:cupredoxin domain-containing protein [Pseudomonas sp. RP23018S]|uniref:cupredoxin domain-containing protein n=1 Tax=Pseudomonas sp. RP23018S TaxID=3096037 RepID=UPI002ACAEC6E|nr:cupredoxin domain-containing protein [Pseudomonas sp. RP23018S]MDZ5601795.1 cupredoxin domain-containing protein [Pseudomonas sp. RP23018S]
MKPLLLTAALSLLSLPALAETFAFGEPASAEKATRSVEVLMKDIAFEPTTLQVKAGETVRFVLINEGQLPHEFNLGDKAMHVEHQKEMLALQGKTFAAAGQGGMAHGGAAGEPAGKANGEAAGGPAAKGHGEAATDQAGMAHGGAAGGHAGMDHGQTPGAHAGMAHGDAGHGHGGGNTVLVQPGQRAELTWTFTSSAPIEFACNVPGHYQAGMVGPLTIE